MKTIMIAKGLDIRVEALRGKISLEENYFNTLNEYIEAYNKQYGELPKIELAYGFIGKSTDDNSKFGIQLVDFQFTPAKELIDKENQINKS